MKPNILEIEHLGKPLLIDADKHKITVASIQALSESELIKECETLTPDWKKDIWFVVLQRVDFSEFVTKEVDYSQTVQRALDVVLSECAHPVKAELEETLFELGQELVFYENILNTKGEYYFSFGSQSDLGKLRYIGSFFEKLNALLSQSQQ